MGGILARYALAYMEKNNKAHNTRLFVSFDSPHQGGNVPLSLQALMFNLSGVGIIGSFFGQSELLNLYNVFTSDGTLQLMANHIQKISNGISYPHIHRVNFMNELNSFNNSFGYPQDCKKIAISNGSYRGDIQKSYNNRQMGSFSGNPALGFTYTSYLGSLLLQAQRWALRTSPGADNWAWDNTDVCVLSHYQMFDIKDANNNPVYSLRNNQCPLDHSPGGYYPWFDVIYDQLIKISGMKVDYRENDKACFVATTSSLDLNTTDKLIKLKNYSKNQIMVDTPFDDIWWDINQENLEHTFLTANMGAWLYQQIMENTTHYSGKTDRVINNISINDNVVYKATNSITVQNTTVSSGKELSLVAGKSIEFLPGFESPIGTTLNADVRNVTEPKRSLANKLPNFKPSASARLSGDFDNFYSDTISSSNYRIPNQNYPIYSKKELSDYTQEFTVYPNPIIDYTTLTVDAPEKGTIYIRLTNSVGAEIYSSVFEKCIKGNNSVSLNFSNVQNGLYTLTVNTQNKIYSRKIAIQR
ncbi:MAG: T9SS C-terminal target domain-containing protein [Cytophagales bacterium]|nr:MAG: T9SS C-terminal target domain-containing protein [Cytophagales bacterium]